MRETLKNNVCWFIKLINNHFTKTPADFLVLGVTKRYLIECKQILFANMNSSFSFDRLSQENELYKFKIQNELNESLVLIMFWNKRLKNSFIYSIPILDYINIKSELLSNGTKSLSLDYLEQFQAKFKVNIIKGKMDIGLRT